MKRMKMRTDKGWRGARLALLQYGPGAGYLGGFTAYIAWRPNITRGAHVGPLYLGITRNANHIPLCSH